MTASSAYRTGTTPTTRSQVGEDLVLASSEADAAAVEAVEGHHRELSAKLAEHVEALIGAASAVVESGVDPVEQARARLVAFCTDDLLPHASAEEVSLYPAAATNERARLLVEAMVAEHLGLEGLVEELRATDRPVRAASAGYALKALFESHLTKENELILPLIAADPNCSLADILAGMHELLGPDAPDRAAAETVASGGCGGACSCGGTDEVDASPVLDVRAVPHAIRHATVFGAFGAIPAGGSLVLLAPHDPRPLLAQLETREPGSFTVEYEEHGPETWQLRLTRSR